VRAAQHVYEEGVVPIQPAVTIYAHLLNSYANFRTPKRRPDYSYYDAISEPHGNRENGPSAKPVRVGCCARLNDRRPIYICDGGGARKLNYVKRAQATQRHFTAIIPPDWRTELAATVEIRRRRLTSGLSTQLCIQCACCMCSSWPRVAQAE